MCFKVTCKKCGNYGWGGCGEHLKPLYASIEKGKHCMCRSWPGVVIPSSDKPSSTTTTTIPSSDKSSSSTTTTTVTG